MPLIQFCSNCWAENLLGATVCERCGTPLSETEPIFYDQKLMRALYHPIPQTREMAAMLLGQRQDRHALPVLLLRLPKRPILACSAPLVRLWDSLETVRL